MRIKNSPANFYNIITRILFSKHFIHVLADFSVASGPPDLTLTPSVEAPGRAKNLSASSVHGESFGASPSFDIPPLAGDEVQDKSVQGESV